jgi:hypothetical protein
LKVNFVPSFSRLQRSIAVLLLICEALAALGCGGPATPAMNGKLSVLIRPPDRKLEPVSVDTPRALPARTGGAMYLEAQFPKPAFIYLIWIDAGGKIKPLYPWNNETIQVTDFSQPPPVRRATNRVFSPMLGRDWTFDGPPGTETVLLLARRTALPESVKLGDLLADLPPPPAPTGPKELATFAIKSDKSQDFSHGPVVGDGKQEIAVDEPFINVLETLAEHFDLVRAVRFTHQDPETSQLDQSPSR